MRRWNQNAELHTAKHHPFHPVPGPLDYLWLRTQAFHSNFVSEFFESPKCARHCAWHWRRTETSHACAQPKVSSGLSSSSASSIKKLLMSPGLHLPPRFLLPCYLSPHSSLPGVFPCTCWAPLPHELLWGRGKSNFSTLHPSLHALRTQ